MIYYPLSVLMLAEIKEVLIIFAPHDIPRFEELLGDGSQWGMKFSYKVQPSPDGLAQAFILGEEFIGDDDVCLILGDNIYYVYYGHGLTSILKNTATRKESATVFGYQVKDPERFGVVEFDAKKKAISIEEKPQSIRVDNGSEFISHKLEQWCYIHSIELKFIQPGCPTQNSRVERFNGSMRREFFNAYLFDTLDEVRLMAREWIDDYNYNRPHKFLGKLSPIEYLKKYNLEQSCSA